MENICPNCGGCPNPRDIQDNLCPVCGANMNNYVPNYNVSGHLDHRISKPVDFSLPNQKSTIKKPYSPAGQVKKRPSSKLSENELYLKNKSQTNETRRIGLTTFLSNVNEHPFDRSDLINYLTKIKIADPDRLFHFFAQRLWSFINRKFGKTEAYIFCFSTGISGQPKKEARRLATEFSLNETDVLIQFNKVLDFFGRPEGKIALRDIANEAGIKYFEP